MEKGTSHGNHRLGGPLLAGLALFVLLVAATPGRAAETVRVGCVEFPPLTFTNGGGTPDGRAIVLLADILKRLGLPWEAKCLPGARLLAGLRDGSVHVAMLIRHPDVADAVLYGQLPMAYLDLDAYRAARTPALGGMNALRGKRVILLRGYGYGGWSDFFKDPDNGLAVSFADSHQAAFRMLANGHGDYLVDYRGPALRAQDETSLPGLQRELLTRLPCYFLVSRKAPGAEALLRRIEDEFARMGAEAVN